MVRIHTQIDAGGWMDAVLSLAEGFSPPLRTQIKRGGERFKRRLIAYKRGGKETGREFDAPR